jgi:hypothetical protein
VNKRRTAQLLTLVVLALALGIGVMRKTGWRLPESKPAEEAQAPQDAVYSMLDSARSGDVKAYLAHYTGPMEAALRQAIAESTESAFAKYLRDSQAAIKGVAVSEPEITNGTEAKIRVEYVYEDRNEIQTMYLDRVSSGWKIARTEGDERIKTLIPYGTPVK